MAVSENFPHACGCYMLTALVGKGTYGYVYKAKSRQGDGGLQTTLREVAIKRIKHTGANSKEKEYAQREVEVMKECDHINIVSYYDSFFEEGTGYFCVVMEHCQTNLRDYIKQMSKPMSEKTFIDLFLQICRGVEYLHSKDILHRDLKPTNILLTDDKTVKIADFGVARVLDLVMFSNLSYVGTHRYMSPEMHHGKDYDEKTDIWGLGCTAYEMATGKPAYDNKSLVDLKTQLGLEQKPDFEEIPYCDAMKNLIKRMLNSSSPGRPKASTLANTLEKHTPCEKEAESEHQEVPKDSGFAAGDSGFAAGDSGSVTGSECKRKPSVESDNIKISREPRNRYPSESDKHCITISTHIQSELVKILQGAEPVTEILRILRTETDRKAQRTALKKVVGSKYNEIRPLIKSLRPVENQLSQSSDYEKDSTISSKSSTE